MLISLLSPILGAGIVGLFGRLFGNRGSVWITTTGLGISFFYSWYLLFRVLNGEIYQVVSYMGYWFSSLENLEWSFTVDEISAVMLSVVSTVAFLVHLYSSVYMLQDAHVSRFFAYLSLFTVSMYLLVLGNNLFILFLGWEGVGLCSYLLINFWFTRLQANKAALKAMIVNRIGDISLITASGLLVCLAGSLNFPVIMLTAIWVSGGVKDMFALATSILLLIAAVGKSAQFGLHTWLPDAMEGPTPVSALIHAATMVTAGVFLLIRMSHWLDVSMEGLYLIMCFGAITAIFAGSVGITQYDIKRVVAYSTCSQLGYMVLICGCAFYSLGLFHLFNHAFFKALLFLGSGSVIHAMGDEQDMRKYGLLSALTPYLGQVFLVASMALMGVPFLAGFYSKDSILEVLVSSYNEAGLWGYWIGLSAALLTTGYSFKVAYWTFFSSTSFGYRSILTTFHNPSRMELLVLSLLGAISICSGYVFKDRFLGLGSNNFVNVLHNLTSLNDAEFLPWYIKIMPILGMVVILSLAYYLSVSNISYLFNLYKREVAMWSLFNFLSHKWYFNLLQNYYVSQWVLNAGYDVFWIWDRWLLEQIRHQ